MSNFKHYIREISAGNNYFTLDKKLNFIATIIGLFEIIMTVCFYFAKIYILMIAGFFTALYFLVFNRRLIKKESFTASLVICLGIVMLSSFGCTMCLGFDSGFSLYTFGCIATIFYVTYVLDSFAKKEFIPVLSSTIILLCYIFNYVMMFFLTPFFEVSSTWVKIFHTLNSVMSFSLVIIFNLLFLWEIKVRNSLLSAQNEQLDELAHKDPLTHLLNRRCMSSYLQKSMNILKTNGKRFSLILADIDDFKHVNDTYGHDAGDQVLVSISSIISQSLRDGDVVCRWGGEEILILIHDPIETASMAAERIRRRVEDNVTTFEGKPIKVTMTFGLSESIPGYKIEQLIQQADDKLYQGKKSGKNCVVI